MRLLKAFIASLLLFTIPTTLIYPQNPLQLTEQNDLPQTYVLSYDDVLRILSELESGELEKKCGFSELEKIKNFVALLAKEGALPEDSVENFSLESDIAELLSNGENPYENALSFASPEEQQYLIIPAVLYGKSHILLCKSWASKQWKHVKDFAKKHKKALIIGAAIIVASAVIIISATAAAPAVAGAAAGAGAAVSDKKQAPADLEAPNLKAVIDDQLHSFKENLVQNQFFPPMNPSEGFSWEESGRTFGALFAHDSFASLQNQLPYRPELAGEIEHLREKYAVFGETAHVAIGRGHGEIDRKFSTDYSYLYALPSQNPHFTTLSFQLRGERALAHGYYGQAVQDFGKVIELSPQNHNAYIERGMAHFHLGEYERSLADYRQFAAQAQKNHPFSVLEFSRGLARGLPRGAYESGEGLLLFLSDFASHPVDTAGQVIESFSTLAGLIYSEEWESIARALSPEAHQLVTQWESLPSLQKGELAGYLIGKHGGDILIPGGLVKIAGVTVKGTQTVAAVAKNLNRTKEIFTLETLAKTGQSGAGIERVVRKSEKLAFIAEEMGMSTEELSRFQQIGKLEKGVNHKYKHLSLSRQESIQLFNKVQEQLKPHQGKYMAEAQIRELIHETGLPTFPRPAGIPENYRVKLSDRGGGMKYVHPNHEQTYVRIMPGKPHSTHPHQQKPYVVQMKNGKTLDKFGNIIDGEAPNAHIPIEDFIYIER